MRFINLISLPDRHSMISAKTLSRVASTDIALVVLIRTTKKNELL